jgi:hypothetical protein
MTASTFIGGQYKANGITTDFAEIIKSSLALRSYCGALDDRRTLGGKKCNFNVLIRIKWRYRD